MSESDRRVISTWLSSDEHAAWSKQAAEAHISVSSFTRLVIRTFLTNQHPKSTASDTPPIVHEPKTSELKVRLTRTELSALNELAKNMGVRRSTLLRTILLAGLSELPLTFPTELDSLAAATWELRKVGVNLNQIAHHLNERAKSRQAESIDPDLIRQLVDTLNQRINLLTSKTRNVQQRADERGKKLRERIRKKQST